MSRKRKPENRFVEMVTSQKDKDESASVEDQQIRLLSGKLGLSQEKGRQRLNKEFEADGMGADFGDFLLQLDQQLEPTEKKKKKKRKRKTTDAADLFEMDAETRRQFELIAAEDAEFLKGMDQLPTDEEEEQEEDFFTSEEQDEATIQNTQLNQQTPQRSDDDNSSEQEQQQPKEDIYGRTTTPAAAYRPPHLRQDKSVSSTEKDQRAVQELNRLINRQLNRISESNMEPIALEIEKIYRGNVTSLVNAVLFDKITDVCCHETQLMKSLVLSCSALISSLHFSIGTEIGGFFVEKIAQKLQLYLDDIRRDKDVSNEGAIDKKPLNLVFLLGCLYNFGVFQCTLLYEFFRALVESFSETEVEMILVLVKYTGIFLRNDDPDALKEMILLVQNRSNTFFQENQRLNNSRESQSSEVERTENDNTVFYSRVRFLVDFIYDLKNVKKNVSELESIFRLKKWLGKVKSRTFSSSNALNLNLKDLLAAEATGQRWWVVGGTWAGYQKPNKEEDEGKELTEKIVVDEEENNLMKLAMSERMNTESRRLIFVAIMGATDYTDAIDKILSIPNILPKQKTRDFCRVVVHCCGSESRYNPYYTHLALQFAKLNQMEEKRNKKNKDKNDTTFTMQLVFWDFFKNLEHSSSNHTTSQKQRKSYNLACFMATLCAEKAMSLATLKVLDFTALTSDHIFFLRVLFDRLMRCSDTKDNVDKKSGTSSDCGKDTQFLQVFQRLSTSPKMNRLRDGLCIFFHQHMIKKKNKKMEKKMIKRGKLVVKLLEHLNSKSAKIAQEQEFFENATESRDYDDESNDQHYDDF